MIPQGPRKVGVAAALALALGTGCAPRTEGWRGELDGLRRDVTSLRSDNAALRERVEALESASVAQPRASTAPRSEPTQEGRPDLKVVRLTPEEPGASGWVAVDPSDPGRSKGAPPPTDAAPTEIRSERGGVVVHRPASPPATPAPPRK